MNREDIFNTVTEIFRDIFDDKSLVLADHTTADDVEEWDSLAHIGIITAIQEEFSIEFSMESVFEMKNVGELIDAIMALHNG